MGLTPFIRGPEWFFGLDALFEGLELITALLLAFFAYRCYLLSNDSRYSKFSLAFASLSIGTGIRAVTDLVIHRGTATILRFFSLADIADARELFITGYSAHVFFVLLGLIILLTIALKIESLPIFLFLLLSTIPFVFISGSMYLNFHGLALLITIFVAGAQYINWKQKPSLPSFLVFAGFTLITLAYIQFIIDLLFHMFYVKAHLTLLIGYLCLLFTFICTIRHGKNCKPAITLIKPAKLSANTIPPNTLPTPAKSRKQQKTITSP